MSDTLYKPANPELREALKRFQEQYKLSNTELGRKLGDFSETAVCKYLNDKFTGNLARLEHAIRAALKNGEQRDKEAGGLFTNFATKQIRSICNTLKENRWMGIAYGEAGVSKTSGIQLVAQSDLSALFLTIRIYERRPKALIDLLCAQIGEEARQFLKSRPDYLEEVLKDSRRIIIVDQAHLLNKTGRQTFCDLHDATRVPILFVGNPEMIHEWNRQAQQFSRIKLCEKITLSKPTVNDPASPFSPEALAEMMIARIAPEAVAELKDEAVRVIRGEGHMRSLDTSLTMAAGIRKTEGKSWSASFRDAESKQVRRYVETHAAPRA